ncbi:MAG: beta-galactosidase [Verrucomicrobia bacterium]|nr:beta-galactosidase [Verrucomicrobiota bacterium]
MKRILTPFVWVTLAAGMAFGETVAYWRFDGDLSAESAPALAGKAGVFEKGTRPVFDAGTPASNIWNGATFSVANPANRSSLRFVNEGVAGAGSPVGGEMTVSGADAKTKPGDLTVETFVKMKRQMPRHALIASKRRNGQTGASWSLSIDPQGCVRVRFDTQPGADSKSGEGFNQSFGSTGSVADGAWHHVALTFDHATQSAVIYVDHVRCGGGVTKGPLVYDDGALVFGRGLDGWLDEVRLSAEVLHPEQFLRTCRFFSEMKPRVPTVAMLDQTPTRVQTALKLDWAKVGTLKPKSVSEIKTSMWSLGCETLDRDLADWDAYKSYLEPLGIRHIRLQGGWGRTEKAKGVYDFAWLDRIVDDAHTRGLAVCLETSYGNRLYDPKAALGPGGTLPEGEETLAAWDKWVETMARRYSAKGVGEWMMYNEPNLVKNNTIEKTTAFNIRTAQIIKRVDPKARIGGLVSAGANPDFIGGFLRGLKEQGKLGLFEWVVYHHYSGNPDATYDRVEKLQELMSELAPKLRLWQGEAGCASEEVQFALSGVDWTELSQAKWNARRMLGDLVRDIRSSVFTISDLSYHKDFISRYGLLKSDSNNAITKVKTVYYVVQNVVSVFNDALERVPNAALTTQCDKKLTAHAFRDKATGLSLVTFWDGTGIPSNECTPIKAQLTVPNAKFKEPVWLDLITGNIYAIPADKIVANDGTYTFKDVPVYDGPAAITDKSLLKFEPARLKKKAKNPMAAASD